MGTVGPLFEYYAVLLVLVGGILGLSGWYFRIHRAHAELLRQMKARWWHAAGPVALGIAVPAVAYVYGDIAGEDEILLATFPATAVLAAVIGATLALGNLREYRRLNAATGGSDLLEEGPAVLSGTATPQGEAPTAPVSGEAALCYTVRVTEHRSLFFKSGTAELAYVREAVPFALETDAGTVAVDPADATLRLRTQDTPTADVTVRDDEPDAAAADRLDSATGYRPRQNRRFAERRLEPNTDVTVLGTVQRDPEQREPTVSGDAVVFRGAFPAVRRRVRNQVVSGAALAVLGFPLGAFGFGRLAGLV